MNGDREKEKRKEWEEGDEKKEGEEELDVKEKLVSTYIKTQQLLLQKFEKAILVERKAKVNGIEVQIWRMYMTD